VLLPVGHRFDLVDVPAGVTELVLDSIRATGYHLGPVACTVEGRLLIWVRQGGDRPVLPDGLDLTVRSAGDYVVAPPFGGTWVIAPVPLNQPTLPHLADILPAVARVCPVLPPEPEAGSDLFPVPDRAVLRARIAASRA
jgi:hypothetical protein